MTITADDLGGVGASDYIVLAMCDGCNDSFYFGEDEFDLPSSPGYHTDISFFNFDWVGMQYGDVSNPNFIDSPEFYVDKRSFHDSADLLIWNINGFANLPDENSPIEISWNLDELAELSADYEIYLYIGDSSYNMRNISNVVVTEEQLLIQQSASGEFISNIEVVIGGCAGNGNIADYYYDQDGDGFGLGLASEFCVGEEPDGWVDNHSDIDDSIYCLSNMIDGCDVCDGENVCIGCPDPNACNYSDLVTELDGSCYYAEEYYDCDGHCILDSDGDNICDELEVLGCTDIIACNYNDEATEDDGSCEYPDTYYDCNGDCTFDLDGDGVCDELEIFGCANPASCFFDSNATEHDGSCCAEADDPCEEPPGEIENLYVQVNSNSVTIDFDQPCGVTLTYWSYSLLEDLNDPSEKVIPSPYTITDLDWGTSYTYYLKVFNSAGSSMTEINFTTEDEPIPADIVGLSYEPGEGYISLQWDYLDNASSYNIIRDDEVIATVDGQIVEYIDNDVYYHSLYPYDYSIQGVNSQGAPGNPSPSISAQSLPVPGITGFSSLPGPGSIVFSWDSPVSYASISDYTFRIQAMGMVIDDNYNDFEYTLYELSFEEEVCLGVQAIHQYGESDIQLICDFSEMPYPPLVSNFNAIGNEGSVAITWSMIDEPNHFINIYRDQQLIVGNLNSIENPPPYINDIYDGYEMLADHTYNYKISASNIDFIEGEISNSIAVTTLPLPVVSDISADPGEGRIVLNWSELVSYGGFGYTYQVFDLENIILFETNQAYAVISNLTPNEEYCFKVKAVSLGGYGISDESEIVCSIPQDAFDGTEGDTDIDWGIQLSVDLLRPSGEIITDAQNMLGASVNAIDGCDSDFDIGESVDPPNPFVKLYFPHEDWTCGLDAGGQYNNDIRSEYNSLNEIKAWSVRLRTNIYEQNFATLSFYFYENAGGNTAYYTSDDVNYIKINNGTQIPYGLLTPASTEEERTFKVIVGDIMPESPIDISSDSGYREIELSWLDGYIPGALTYESTSYNIYRDNELVGNTTELSFIDRGLDFSTEYEYQISGINIAGEGEKSIPIMQSTLDNRPPIADAGIDLLIYDFINDGLDRVEVSLPMNISNFEGSLLNLENQSYDPDNSYLSNEGLVDYNPVLESLSYSWSPENQFSTEEIYTIQSDGYGLKSFILEVNDGDLDSDIADTIFVSAMPLPAPAKVYIDTTYSGLYSIDIVWEESNYTGEPYIKSSTDSFYNSFEIGDYFEDVNGNGIYDSGSDPMPAFYGLSNLNNFEGYKNIAEYYQIKVDGLLIDSIAEPCSLSSDDLYLNQYCYTIPGLNPSTVYSISVNACNYNNECNNSDELAVSTGDAPYVNVIYPNGAEIIGMDDPLDIELDFGSGQRYIDSLYLSITIDNSAIWDTTIFTSSSQNIISSDYSLSLANLPYVSGLNPGSDVIISIVDEGGIDYLENEDYEDESDNSFIIASNQIGEDFSSGWHIIGTPVVLDSAIGLQSHINSGTDLSNGMNFWQIIDEDENIADPISPSNMVFQSGKGYYFNLYSTIGEDFSENLTLSGGVETEYLLDDLHVGWNLISNPLVVSMNINNIDIINENGIIMDWNEANQNGLISPYLLEFNHLDNTLHPAYAINPYKGYWVYLYEDVAMRFESKVESPDSIDGDLIETDFLISLKSRAFGASSSSFGDLIQLGYSLDASNEFVEGVDLPDLNYQYFNEYASMYILHDDADWNTEYNRLTRDIREHYQPVYFWDIIGQTNNILSDDNPDAEIELFWDISDIDPNYTVVLQYGPDFSNQMDMISQDYVKLNQDQFLNMRIVVELQNYFSGCSNQNACNYFCIEKPWECPESILPSNFVDDNTCDLYSCVGCMDNSASNYNPNATVDSICEGGDDEGLNCMYDINICGEFGACVEQICEYNESYLFPLADQEIYVEDDLVNEVPIYLNNYSNVPVYGVEIELIFDSDMINIPLLDFSNSIIDDYSKLYYIDNDTLRFVAYSGTPTLSSGILFDMQIEALGESGESTTILFNKSLLNDYSIDSNALNLMLSEGLFDVSGYISYYSNENFPMAADLNLVGYSEYNNPYSFNVIDTLLGLSSEAGDFNFDLGLKGNYIMQASRDELPGSDAGLSAVDASRIARYLIDLIDFNEYQLLAADVDMNGQVSAVDAALVARYLIGLTDQLNDSGQHWRFSPDDDFYFNLTDDLGYEIDIYDLRPLVSDLYNQSAKGVRIGDVDGSWISDSQFSRYSNQEDVAEVDVDPKKLLSIPIAIQNGSLIEGLDLKIKYNSESFLFDEFYLSNDLHGYSILSNDLHEGELSLVVYANSDIAHIDHIFGEISFIVMSEDVSASIIEIDKILVNGEDVNAGFLISSDGSDSCYRVLSISSYSHPVEFSLGDAFPNPFNPSTTIPFSVPFESNVDISLYDINGRFVSSILSKNMNSGNHLIQFNGEGFASGLYLITMSANSLINNESFTKSSKILLLK